MSRRKHWSEVYACRCGKTFRSYAAEASHRHNFPAMCRRPKQKGKTMIDHPAPIAAKAPELATPAPFNYVDVNLIGADETAIQSLKSAGFGIMSGRVEQEGNTTVFVGRLTPPITTGLTPVDDVVMSRLADRFDHGPVRMYFTGAERPIRAWLGAISAELVDREFIAP